MDELRQSKVRPPHGPEAAREFSVLRTLRALTKPEKEVSDAHTDKSRLSAALSSEHGLTRQQLMTHKRQLLLINEMRNVAFSSDDDRVGLADTLWLRNCIIARNGDVRKAIALASNYLKWRSKLKYEHILCIPSAPVIELLSRGLFISAGNFCRQNSPVLTIRYRSYNPDRFDIADVAVAFGIMVEFIIRQFPKCEIEGVTLMEDLHGVTLGNLDVRLLRFLWRTLSRTFPIRIRAVYYVRPSRLMRTVVKLIAPFVAHKLHTAAVVVDHDDGDKLLNAFEQDQIPSVVHPVGCMTWTPELLQNMVDRVLDSCSKWPSASKS